MGTALKQLFDLKVWVPALAILLPLVVAFVTKRSTSSGIQGVLFSFLAAVLGVVSAGVIAAQHDQPFLWTTAFVAAITAWVTGQTAHLALFKALGVNYKLQDSGPIKDRRVTAP